VEEARKQFAEAEGQLRVELEEETILLHKEQHRNAELVEDQASLDQMIIDTDAPSPCSPAYRFYWCIFIPFSFAFLPRLFPESQAHAHARVTKLRAENTVPDPDVPWNAYDHLIALHARITHMRVVDRHLNELPKAALKIFKRIWPWEVMPDNLTLLSQKLQDADRSLSEWRHSAARTGADAALQFACSWYEELDMDALHSMRGNAPTDIVPERNAQHCDRAYRIAHYASTNNFIPPPADIVEEFTDDEEEEGEEAVEDEADVEPETPEEAATGNLEQGPEVPVIPEPTPEAPAQAQQASKAPASTEQARRAHLRSTCEHLSCLTKNNAIKFPPVCQGGEM
jgi:hypothetical protein